MPDPSPLRVLVVDDEPMARESIRRELTGRSDVIVVGDAADGPAGVAEIDRLAPDVVFLDIELPGWSGLEVLERARHCPAVIFTTAHEHYAIRALQLGAVDYVLKPFGPTRLTEALERVAQRLRNGNLETAVVDRLRNVLEARPPLTRVYVRTGREIACVRLETVTHIEACDDYVTLHAGASSFLIQSTMAALEQQLDPAVFLRVHRSHIVNLDHVESAVRVGDRRYSVRLDDGRDVPVSRTGAAALTRLARGWLSASSR